MAVVRQSRTLPVGAIAAAKRRSSSLSFHSPSSRPLRPITSASGRSTKARKLGLASRLRPLRRLTTQIASGLRRNRWSSMSRERFDWRSACTSAVTLRETPHQPADLPTASKAGSPLTRTCISSPSAKRTQTGWSRKASRPGPCDSRARQSSPSTSCGPPGRFRRLPSARLRPVRATNEGDNSTMRPRSSNCQVQSLPMRSSSDKRRCCTKVEYSERMSRLLSALAAARPTAVSMAWAIRRVLGRRRLSTWAPPTQPWRSAP